MSLAPTTQTDPARVQLHLDPAIVPQIMDSRLTPALLAQLDVHLCDAAEMSECVNALDYQIMIDTASHLKGDVRAIEEAIDPIITTLFAMHRASTARRGELTDPAMMACHRLEALATGWMQAEQARKREEAAKIQRQMEADARAEREEADRIAQEAADKMAQEGRHAEAEAVIDQRASEAAMEAQRPVMQVLAAPVLPAGVKPPAAQRVIWKARPKNNDAYSAKMTLLKAAMESPLLSELFIVDDAEIQRRAGRQKGEFRIPGYESYAEASTVTRAAR